jgi:hypothetical protein
MLSTKVEEVAARDFRGGGVKRACCPEAVLRLLGTVDPFGHQVVAGPIIGGGYDNLTEALGSSLETCPKSGPAAAASLGTASNAAGSRKRRPDSAWIHR